VIINTFIKKLKITIRVLLFQVLKDLPGKTMVMKKISHYILRTLSIEILELKLKNTIKVFQLLILKIVP